jgi:hypothetical protein
MAKTTSPELAKATMVWQAFITAHPLELSEETLEKLHQEKLVLMERIAFIDRSLGESVDTETKASQGIAQINAMMKLNLSERIIMEALRETFVGSKGAFGAPEYLSTVRGLYAAPFTGGAVPSVSVEDKDRVLKALDREGATVGELAKATGMDTKTIAKCAAVLISEQKARKSGEKRGTRYHLV